MAKDAHRGSVLVIEDEELVRDAMCDMLELEGIPYLAASDGAEGVALLTENGSAVGVVVLDLSMPGMSGKETFARLRALARDVPIVLSSGHDEAAAMGPFAGEQVAGYLQKPYPLAEMIALVQSLLNHE